MPASFRPHEDGSAFASPPANDVARRPSAYSPAEIEGLVRYTADFVHGPAVPDAGSLVGGDVARGGELYRLNCSACHQMAGSGGALAYGTVGPPLSDATPREVQEAVRTGPGSMPAFPATALDDSSVRDVVAYVDYLHAPEDRGGIDLWHLGPVPEGLVAWGVGVVGALALCRWLGQRDRLSRD